MGVLEGLFCVSILIIVVLLKKIKSLREQLKQGILDEQKRAEAKIEKIQKEAVAKVPEANKNAEQKIKEYKERIEIQREALTEKNEKALMVDAIMALEGLGERLNHIKEEVEIVSTRQLNYYDETADFMRLSSKAFPKLIDDIDSIKSEVSEIFWIKSEIDNVKSVADDIKSETSSIYYKLN